MNKPYLSPLRPPSQGSSRPWEFLVQPSTTSKLSTCDKASSSLCREEQSGAWALQAVTCKTWKCRYCAQIKIKRLAYLTSEAKPNRFITLTTDTTKYASPLEAWKHTAVRVPEAMRYLRTRFGELEYLRVTELTQQGFPHYHMLVRSAYIPQPVIKAYWLKSTGNKIVDVRKVNSAFNAYWYLVKYLSKMHNLEWTERHVSYSRKFFPEEPELQPKEYDFVQRVPIGQNPLRWLEANYTGETVCQIRPGLWFLPHAPPCDTLPGPSIEDRRTETAIASDSLPCQKTLNLTGPTNVQYF